MRLLSAEWFSVIGLLAGFAFSSGVSAQEGQEEEAATEQVEPDEANTDEAPEEGGLETPSQMEQAESQSLGSSEVARGQRMYGVSLRTGFHVGIFFGLGVDGYYTYRPSLQIGGFYTSGTADFTKVVSGDSFTTFNKADVKTSMLFVYGRYFLGNTLYASGGFGRRTVDLEYDIESTIDDLGIQGTVESSTIAVSAGIGNQWSWDDGIYLGCEWIGYALPLAASSDATSNGTGQARNDPSLKELASDLKDAGETLGKTSSFNILMVNFGYAF
jgi:hypothetical protein